MHIYTIARKCFFTALLFTGTTYIASAQNYTFFNGKEATEIAKNLEDEVSVHIKVRNNTKDTLELTWQMLENGFSANDWNMVALCDPYLCHNNIPTTFSPPLYANTAGDSVSEFKMLATPKASASVSKMRIVVWETGKEEQKDTLTFTVDARSVGLPFCTYPASAPSLNAYPNPAQNVLNFDIESSGNNQVEILTLNGKKLLAAKLSGATNSVNIESLPAGLYLARITGKNGIVKVGKFTKQ